MQRTHKTLHRHSNDFIHIMLIYQTDPETMPNERVHPGLIRSQQSMQRRLSEKAVPPLAGLREAMEQVTIVAIP